MTRTLARRLKQIEKVLHPEPITVPDIVVNFIDQRKVVGTLRWVDGKEVYWSAPGHESQEHQQAVPRGSVRADDSAAESHR